MGHLLGLGKNQLSVTSAGADIPNQSLCKLISLREIPTVTPKARNVFWRDGGGVALTHRLRFDPGLRCKMQKAAKHASPNSVAFQYGCWARCGPSGLSTVFRLSTMRRNAVFSN